VEELGQIQAARGLRQVHLLGHSWGSRPATDYALTRPAGVVSLVLASPPLCIPRWPDELAAIRRQLPPEVQSVLDQHERAGTTDSDAYQAATMAFSKRHVCRLDP